MDNLFHIVNSGDCSVIIFSFFVVFQMGTAFCCAVYLASITEFKKVPIISAVLSQIWWAILAPNTSWFMALILLSISGCAHMHCICRAMGVAVDVRRVVKTLCRLS